MKIDARKCSAIRAEAATESRSIVVEVQALAVTKPSPQTPRGMIYEWSTLISVDPQLAAVEIASRGKPLSELIKDVSAAALDALWGA